MDIITIEKHINDYGKFVKYSFILCLVIGWLLGYLFDDYFWNSDNYTKFYGNSPESCDSYETLDKISDDPANNDLNNDLINT